MGVYKSQLSYREGVGQPVIYFVDTIAEMPATGLLTGADIAFCHEDKCWYVATSTTQMGKAATAHSHTAAQLASGTPTGSKFLRDDLTWAAPPTGAGGSLPAGCILMWHGLLGDIPGGFVLCDGTNGTPDLRDKFVKGTAADTDPGTTGGNLTHAHANHASHNHTYSEIVNHTHPVTDPGHTHTQNAHNHVITSQTATTGSATSYEHGVLDTTSAETEATEVTANATAVNQNATTGVTTENPSGGVAQGTTNGPSATLSHDSVNHEPPYYTVAFIMKT